MPYLIDSSALIEAKNVFYRFSFCPGFWDWISEQHSSGSICTIQKVESELKEGADQLATWATTAIPATFFIAPTAQVVTTQATVARWVSAHATYKPAEKARFLAKADPWLVAEALVNGQELITFEEVVPSNSKKVKIPNVAAQFGVNCVSLFDALELSGVQLNI